MANDQRRLTRVNWASLTRKHGGRLSTVECFGNGRFGSISDRCYRLEAAVEPDLNGRARSVIATNGTAWTI